MFNEDARLFLPALASRCHVWLVDSDQNRKAARDYWQQAAPVDDELASGVTTFTRVAQAPEEALAAVLELVEDHHGEFAHDPPVNELLLLGMDPTESVLGVLNEWGYERIESRPDGLLALKCRVPARRA